MEQGVPSERLTQNGLALSSDGIVPQLRKAQNVSKTRRRMCFYGYKCLISRLFSIKLSDLLQL
jgi:hypothetical protein